MSDTAKTPWDSAAVLIWAPPGPPSPAEALGPQHVQTPPHPNPVPFWRFRDAVEHAGETIENARHHGKEPWIKVAAQVFGPMEVSALYRGVLAERGR